MRTTLFACVASLSIASGGAMASAQTAPTEVRMTSAADAKKACAAKDDTLVVYTAVVDSSGFRFAPYDAGRARLVIDSARGFRGPTTKGGGGWELVLHDLRSGRVAPGRPELDIALPVSPGEAKSLLSAHQAGSLELTLWFQLAAPADRAPACAKVHRVGEESLRMAIEPLAFVLKKGREPLASGELPSFAQLRAGESPVVTPRVVVSAPFRTGQSGRASAPIARAAARLEPPLLGCYRRALIADPSLRGSLVAGADIAEDGRVARVRAEIDGLGQAEVVGCALEQVRATKFPRGAERISIPISFSD